MPSPTPAPEATVLAQFTIVNSNDPIPVHFNPASLQYTVSNTLREQGSGARRKQYVSQTTAKLTMELVFDTTATGQDVRVTTDKMARLLQPHGPSGRRVPPVVEFSWGLYRFTGMVEQYKETLDFFSASGVPLRSGINLTLSSQDVVFTSGRNPNASVDGDLQPEPVSVPAPPGPGGGPAGVANALGDPRAARAIAAANGSSSLRFSAGAALAVSAGADVSLAPAAAFSVGGGGGLSLSGAAGAGIGVGGGISVDAGAGASVALGASATAGFSGLRATSVSAGLSLPDPRAALALTADAGSGGGVQFGLGGRAQASGSASLSADVGANAELTARLGFGGS